MGKRIDNREFVVTWLRSESVEKVAETFGITVSSASLKASGLRKLGVKLPKFTRKLTNSQLEIAQLNSLIRKHSEPAS